MPIAISSPPEPPVPLNPPGKRWTRAECALLESSGVVNSEKLELIEGELIEKMAKNRRHVNALLKVMLWLMDSFGRDRVNPEAPVDVAPADNGTNEPQPDLIVLKKQSAAYQLGPPQPADLELYWKSPTRRSASI